MAIRIEVPSDERPAVEQLLAVREAFGKFVGAEIRDEILKETTLAHGRLQEVTLLFADLRGFTGWVESTPLEEVAEGLNMYLGEMERAIRRHRGLVLQFIGDEIEAVFGAPLRYEDHAEMAVAAALEMRCRLQALNVRRARDGRPRLVHGIGIHTGGVLARVIGSDERRFYTLIGEAVNIASRIQELNKDVGSDILVSGATRRDLGRCDQFAAVDAAGLRYRRRDIDLYRLL
jgi:adenylate cyclase